METFVIMLDHWLEVFPLHWPITATSNNIDALMAMGQYDGSNPTVVPRGAHAAQLLHNKSLVNARTGAVDSGGIYRLT